MRFKVSRLEETPSTYILSGALECTSEQDKEDMEVFTDVLPRLLSSAEYSAIARFVSVDGTKGAIKFRNLTVSSLLQVFKLLTRNTGCDFNTNMGSAVCVPASCSLKFYHMYKGEPLLF